MILESPPANPYNPAVPILAHLLTALCAYLCGSIPTGFLVARAMGVDIRSHGSGNIGATNVFRILGKGPGIFVLLVDALKGALPVLFLPAWIGHVSARDAIPFEMIAALGAVLGHNVTCWLRFKGGKGVATYLGVLLGLWWQGALIFAAIWLAVAYLTRYSSLAALIASLVTPVALLVAGQSSAAFLFSLMTSLIVIMHRANVRRLLSGTEGKIGQKG